MRFSLRKTLLIVALFALMLISVGCSSFSLSSSSDGATATAQASGCRGGIAAVDVTRYSNTGGVTTIADLATPTGIKPATPEVAEPLCVIELVKVTLNKHYPKTDIKTKPDKVTFGGVTITVVGGTPLEGAIWSPYDNATNAKQGILSLRFSTPAQASVKVTITGLA